MSKIATRTIGSLALVGLALLPDTAQADGLALNRFEAAPAGDRMFGVQSPYTAGHLVPHVMLLANYAYNPLVLTRNKGRSDVGSVVAHQMFLNANASLALWDRLTINLDVPVALVQSGDDPVGFDGQPYTSPDSPEMGDIRLGVRGTILGEHDSAFSLGVGGYFWFPQIETGDADISYVSDQHVRGSVELLLGGVADWFYYGAAFGPEFRNGQQYSIFTNNADYDNAIDQGSMMSFSGGLGVLLGEDRNVQLGPEFDVNITLSEVRPRNTNAELRLGAKYRFLDDFIMGAAAGPGLAPGIGTPDLRVVGMLAYSPDLREPPPDADSDGISDEVDACPKVAGVENEDPDKHGCPPDKDGDGVPDADDQCPDEAPPAGQEDPNKPGCALPPDGDGDGVPDADDQCPDQAFKAGEEDPQKRGCPKPPDRDGDGVLDADDQCPDIAAPPDNADPKRPGCPKPADTDGDGIVDPEDACPAESGPANTDATKNGCPTAVRVTAESIDILQKVEFDFGTANIKPVSDDLLKQVAQVLREHPEILKLEVQGHTDSRGPGRINTKLSQDRADAVRKALVERKVEEGRLDAKGFGEDKPIADNNTDEGRAKNRRVEFKILERKAK